METQQDIIQVDSLFNKNYLESKSLYLYYFKQLPSVTWLNNLDNEKVLEYVKEVYANLIIGIYQHGNYNSKKDKTNLKVTMVVLFDQRIIEMVGDYCEILHTHEQAAWATAFMKDIKKFRRKQKSCRQDISIISKDNYDVVLKTMQVKKTSLDLSLYYEDDFGTVDKVIRERLTAKNGKGIVLLHGLPGTGKTTYLRYLIGRLKKKVMILSAAVAEDIMMPEVMEMLTENANSILIIEDAEHIIMDRKSREGSSVSNLLNISDGLMGDFLNLQVICTFNSPVTAVDTALMRKGRLIARYEFGKLSVRKSQRLSDHLGFNRLITQPMTIAEIANQHETSTSRAVEVIGFRRQMPENEAPMN